MAKRFVGIYQDQSSLERKIEELKQQGHHDSDFSVVGRDDAAEEASGASWIDQVKSTFSKEPPLRETLKRVGHSDDEAERHYAEVERGGLALFVKDRDHDHDHHHDHEHHHNHDHDHRYDDNKVENPGNNAYESNHREEGEKSDRAKWKADDLD
ncbi:general stress protein [Exiguobacterium sp. RIT341]|uniref:general stress protein n=1 Tax=Exiguobacterium sp. RIT341 TaxID=1470592 RepID=UPI000453B2F0|nr:general stress protein [Exiguobacterium sp. RIT341]EZP61658.1 Heat induced stress protein YflT [Exiguobacterium sp. RIT341]